MGNLPESVRYTIVGAGVHGLSTAWHLAMELEARGRGSGQDIVVLDKTGPGAGASGIACGCVRNFYMTEPIHALLRHSVDVWMYDPVAFGFQQVGYVSVGEENQISDYERIHKSQNAVGYHSELYVGQDARRYLKNIWPDFNTSGVEVTIFERVSGYAGTDQVIKGLAQKCADHGVRVIGDVEVLDYTLMTGQVKSVVTNHGEINTDLVIWGLGAWTPKHWQMLDQPMTLDCYYPDGDVVKDKDMWTYWRLLEGEVYYDQPYLTADGLNPPVLHVELMNTPVVDEESGRQLRDYTYVYFKNGNERMDQPGLQGGTVPVKIGPEAILDPYGHANDAYQAGTEFADYLCAAMAQTMSRFQGIRPSFRKRRNGGIGAFTPDNVPIIDWVLPNVYMIADSNHGFKMLGAGKLVAKQLMGDDVAELKPFSFGRFAEGRTFGSTNSHSPWV
ncbi:MAG TPA: FAD-binding oxidoreductase [Anaerolineae bacterium]|jgi:glycine/D-amino acid oxidase-like deaminating enzyme|nr:FAD-binding oxidoreductase [Anaerolineae bacterium]